MKKFMAIILTLAMVMSLCVVPASAADGKVTITITPDKSRVDTATGDAVVTYTIKAKVNDPTLKVASLTITLDPSAGLTLAEQDEDSNATFYYKENANLKYDKNFNKDGIFATNADYAPKTKTFVAVGTTSTRNLNASSGEVLLMTIMGKIAKGTTGSVTLKTTQHSYGDPSGATASQDCDVTPASVTIMKPPITSVSATVSQPVKGHPLDTSVNVHGATTYTANVMWKDVEENMTATGDAKPGKIYTALITLKAKEGETFATSLNNTTTLSGYTIQMLNSTELLLSKEFDRTNVKETTGFAIDNTTLTVAVPTAEPNMEQKAELPLTAKVNYDDGTNETVEATWSIVDPKPEGVDIEADGKLTVTNKAADGTVKVKAAYNGMTDEKTVTITKEPAKESKIVLTAPSSTTIDVPTGSGVKNDSGKCTAKVYDQYGNQITSAGVTYESDPATMPTGVTFASTTGEFFVDNTAQNGTVKVIAKYGTVTSNPVAFTIKRAASVATSLTINGSADSVNVPTVTEPGTTRCAYASYTAKVKDQYGEVMDGQTIEWSVTDKPGVTFNNGQLTVTNKADAGTVTITAKSGTFTETKPVTINKEPAKATLVEIYDQVGGTPETRLLIPAGTGTKDVDYTAKVYDQYGVYMPAEMVHWALNPTKVTGVVLDDTSIPGSATLKVDNSATSGTTFKLKATTATLGTTGDKELKITVQKKEDVSSKINFNGGSLTYNGAGQKYEKAALDSSVTAGEGGMWTYTYAVKSGGTGMLDTATGLPKIVGTYTVTATYEDSSNIGSKSATLNITPKTVDIPAPDTTVYTYDGTAKTYQISDSADYTVNHATQTNANETGYTVTVALTDENNTIWADGNTIVKHYTFKIMKATPTGEPAYTKITAAGKTLADADLKTGTITPSGTIKWVDNSGNTLANDTTVAKNTEYKWLFTPTDTTNYKTLTGSLTPYYVAPSSGGGSYVPKTQKPEITIIGSGKADLSADGRTATITANAGHELVSVVLNGKEMGKVEKLTGLKTGDKATITFKAKTDGKAEMDKMIAQKASKLTLMARSAKTAKLNIKVVVKGDLKAITDAGYTVKYKFYRSTKKSAGYKAVLTKKAPTYVNTYGKKGTMYYYKARVMIYDKEGNFVAQTALKQCKYANRLWTK